MTWRHLLLPLAPLYRGVVAARGAAFNRGWLRREGLGIPVISVGNLSFGGTGKTPTVIALVRDLVRLGRRPAVLSRGYRRHSRDLVVVMGPHPKQGVDEVGDEPLEMARRLPGVPIVVDADRVRGGREALRLGADVVVLDDGFQHRRLERDLDLVLLDAGDPWAGGRLPPLGRLREPLRSLQRASAVLVTKVPENWQPVVADIRTRVARIAPDLPLIAVRMYLQRVRLPDEGWQGPEVLKGQRVFAFAGLGRPAGFSTHLEDAGAEVAAYRWFPDHHRYTADDIETVLAEAAAVNAVPVTTAKDAVKLPSDTGVWVVEAAMVPVEGGWERLWRVEPEVVS